MPSTCACESRCLARWIAAVTRPAIAGWHSASAEAEMVGFSRQWRIDADRDVNQGIEMCAADICIG